MGKPSAASATSVFTSFATFCTVFTAFLAGFFVVLAVGFLEAMTLHHLLFLQKYRLSLLRVTYQPQAASKFNLALCGNPATKRSKRRRISPPALALFVDVRQLVSCRCSWRRGRPKRPPGPPAVSWP